MKVGADSSGGANNARTKRGSLARVIHTSTTTSKFLIEGHGGPFMSKNGRVGL